MPFEYERIKPECIQRLQEFGCSIETAKENFEKTRKLLESNQGTISDQQKEIRKAMRSLYRRR